MRIASIITEAKLLGACRAVDGIRDYKRLVELMLAPEGREFCHKFNFPGMDILRAKKQLLEPYGLLVDCGRTSVRNRDVCLAGQTQAEIEIADNTRVYTVMLMHGARVRIKASGYAVILVANVSGGEVMYDIDKTVRIL